MNWRSWHYNDFYNWYYNNKSLTKYFTFESNTKYKYIKYNDDHSLHHRMILNNRYKHIIMYK